jgi:hypothetical protein
MAVVYVTNQHTAIDYSPLSKYGTVVFLTRGSRHPADRELVKDIVVALVESKPNDYLAISGRQVESAIALAVWTQMHPTAALFFHYGEWYLVPLAIRDFRVFIEQARDLLQHKR